MRIVVAVLLLVPAMVFASECTVRDQRAWCFVDYKIAAGESERHYIVWPVSEIDKPCLASVLATESGFAGPIVQAGAVMCTAQIAVVNMHNPYDRTISGTAVIIIGVP